MKTKSLFLAIIFSLTFYSTLLAQIDSLEAIVHTTLEDTVRVNALIELSKITYQNSPDDAIHYAVEAADIAENINFNIGLGYAYKYIGLGNYMLGEYPEAIISWQKALEIFQTLDAKMEEANMLSNLGAIYYDQIAHENALNYFLQALKIAEEISDSSRMAVVLMNIGNIHTDKSSTRDLGIEYYRRSLKIARKLNDIEVIGTLLLNIGNTYIYSSKSDSALIYLNEGLSYLKKTNSYQIPFALSLIAYVYFNDGDFQNSIIYNEEALANAKKYDNKYAQIKSYLGLGENYIKNGAVEEAIAANNSALSLAEELNTPREIQSAYDGLRECYAKLGDYSSAYKYALLELGYKDTIYNAEMDKKLQAATFTYDIEKKQGEIELLEKDKIQKIQQNRNQRLWIFSISGALLSALLLSFILYRNNKIKQKTNALLKKQKQQIQTTFEKLKATQNQLIYSEKMASLGEITAGIAHEIQNPLNFVNNFSDLNKELVDEANEELDKGNPSKAKLILTDLKDNEEKINHHGKRAESIVKGMLLHSHRSSGQHESTDINALCDECLRLSFQGFRAKDKSFNADYKFEADEKLPKIEVVPQDIGRVLLNLINNAFYAVNKKSVSGVNDFKPMVVVSTRLSNKKVELKVQDNGNGIPNSAKDKIFQPFFTTKPTGEGTGLGLSISYDIITKVHHGEIRVESKENQGTTFIITLPVES